MINFYRKGYCCSWQPIWTPRSNSLLWFEISWSLPAAEVPSWCTGWSESLYILMCGYEIIFDLFLCHGIVTPLFPSCRFCWCLLLLQKWQVRHIGRFCFVHVPLKLNVMYEIMLSQIFSKFLVLWTSSYSYH